MTLVADDPPPSVADLAAVADDGRAWVCCDDQDRPVAYLLVDIVDGAARTTSSPRACGSCGAAKRRSASTSGHEW